MNEFGTKHKVRTLYIGGLFQLRVCDALRMVAVVGPKRTGAPREQLTDGEVANLRQHAINKARQYSMLGYEMDLSNCRTAAES